MENRIIQKKLNLFHHLVNLPDTELAKQMVNAQSLHKFPGLVTECQDYIKELDLPNITVITIKQNYWKKIVKKAIREKNEKELKEDIEKHKKVKEYSKETFEQKQYFRSLNLKEARNIFKYRAKMTQYVKRNYPNDPKYRQSLWQCAGCNSAIDTQSHVMWCQAYSDLRKNKDFNDDKDLANYIEEVLKIRETIDTVK